MVKIRAIYFIFVCFSVLSMHQQDIQKSTQRMEKVIIKLKKEADTRNGVSLLALYELGKLCNNNAYKIPDSASRQKLLQLSLIDKDGQVSQEVINLIRKIGTFSS